jgi:hypothetical protein
MAWQLSDPLFRQAIAAAVQQAQGRCALAGVVGVQVHVACAVGLEKLGPPAHVIELVLFDGGPVPEHANDMVVVQVDPLGFEASVEAGTQSVEIAGSRFPVAAPEHILGMLLAGPELPVDAKWASFVLMRTLQGRLDLEEARGFIKRSPHDDRQALLAELAYLAA